MLHRAIVGTAVLALFVSGLAAGESQTRDRIECYRIQTTCSVTLMVPAKPGTSHAAYRDAQGKWKQLRGEVVNGALKVSLKVEDLKRGETFLVLDVPEWLELDDSQPPAVLRFEIDGKPVETGKNADLGTITEPVKSVVLEFEDQENPIDPSSLAVIVDGRRSGPSDPGIAYHAVSKRRGVLTCDLAGLEKYGEGNAHVVRLEADDLAIDEAMLAREVRFQWISPHRMPDGTLVSTDSLTDSPGWRNWSVVADGQVMKAGDPTTAGFTWMSAKSDKPHWIQFTFPEPRTVGKVEIWWAFWECYRTSVQYEVQTWDGERWGPRAAVKQQGERQCSVHMFDPVQATKVRILQPGNCGHPGRMDLMWIAEAKVGEE